MKVVCPTCSAEFEVPVDAVTVECPYCGTVFEVRGRAKVEVFYFPLSREDPYDRLTRFIVRQYGVPEDVRVSSTLTGRRLHLVPVYMYHLEGKYKVFGRSSRLDVYFVNTSSTSEIGKWAAYMKIPPEVVKSRAVTLNFDEGESSRKTWHKLTVFENPAAGLLSTQVAWFDAIRTQGELSVLVA